MGIKTKLKRAKTPQEQFELIEKDIKEQEWGHFIKWDKVNIKTMMLLFETINDDETSMWKDETPEEIKEKGNEYILGLRKLVVRVI